MLVGNSKTVGLQIIDTSIDFLETFNQKKTRVGSKRGTIYGVLCSTYNQNQTHLLPNIFNQVNRKTGKELSSPGYSKAYK